LARRGCAGVMVAEWVPKPGLGVKACPGTKRSGEATALPSRLSPSARRPFRQPVSGGDFCGSRD